MPSKTKDPATAAPADDLFKTAPDAAAPAQAATADERPSGPTQETQPAAESQQQSPPPAKPASPVAKRDPLPFYPTNSDEMWRYATMLSQSKLLPSGFYAKGDWEKERCRVADVHVVLMKGHDLGLKPMQAIGTIHVIDGKAEVGALLMVALIRKSGACAGWKLVRSDERSAIYKTRRSGDDDWTEFEYTIEEAELMGLPDKGRDERARENNQWRKQPRTMLRRRCQSMLAREVYPDVVMGLYDHDELSETSEIADRLGLREEQVAGAIDTPNQAILPEGRSPFLKRLDPALREQAPADPLKARMAAKVAGSRAARCSRCGSILDPRDSDPCIACADPEPEPTDTAQPEAK